MDRQLQNNTPNNRTAVQNILRQYTPTHRASFNNPYTGVSSEQNKNGYKKVVLSAVLAVLAMFIYSSVAFSLTDHVATHLNVDLFSHDGEPNIIAILIHTVVFGFFTFFIISLF